VSSFLAMHPGGQGVLKMQGGKPDSTGIFEGSVFVMLARHSGHPMLNVFFVTQCSFLGGKKNVRSKHNGKI
jgi:cytochrome b involved in lipid metabolism